MSALNPNGIPAQSQGCEERATLGDVPDKPKQPGTGCGRLCGGDATPLGLMMIGVSLTQGSPADGTTLIGLEDKIPLGFSESDSLNAEQCGGTSIFGDFPAWFMVPMRVKKTSRLSMNLKHPTLNIERRTPNRTAGGRDFGVRCSTLGVRCFPLRFMVPMCVQILEVGPTHEPKCELRRRR